MKISGGSAWLGMSRSVEGLRHNSDGMAQAAAEVRSASMDVLNGDRVMPVDRVELRGPSSMEEGLIEMKMSKHGYSANLRAVRASDEAFESLLDMVLPSSRDRD